MPLRADGYTLIVVETPADGVTRHFVWRANTEHGRVIDVVSLGESLGEPSHDVRDMPRIEQAASPDGTGRAAVTLHPNTAPTSFVLNLVGNPTAGPRFDTRLRLRRVLGRSTTPNLSPRCDRFKPVSRPTTVSPPRFGVEARRKRNALRPARANAPPPLSRR